MSDGDWDAEDYDAPVVPTASKSLYADEDAEDDVKESWEDSDDEETAAKKAEQANKAPPPVRQKGITKAKIAEKEAAEAARLQELAALADEDPRERRKREMQMQMAQDLENARALLGDAGISEKVVAGTAVEGGNPFAAFPNPRTKADMESFANALAKYIVDNYSNKPLYHEFANTLVRETCLPLKDLDVRKCASTLTAVANEKQKAAREGTAKKGKGKGKPQLGVVGSGGNKAAMSGRGFSADLDAHTTALDDDYDDDFM